MASSEDFSAGLKNGIIVGEHVRACGTNDRVPLAGSTRADAVEHKSMRRIDVAIAISSYDGADS